MARISNSVKAQYQRLDMENSNCFYCGTASSMDDLTPHPKANDVDKTMFSEDFTMVRTCRKCWGRIYSANIQNAGVKYNVPQGCMTLDQKRDHLGVNLGSDVKTNAFVRTHDGQMVVPVGAQKVEGGPWIVDGISVYPDEMMALQTTFLGRMFEYPNEIIEQSLVGQLASGALEIEREGFYRTILGLD